MADTIKDAATGSVAKVDANQRLHTQSVTATESDNANKNGNAYNINTGVITLTSADDTPIMYVKNNETKDLHITAIAVGVGPSTNGTGSIPKITVIRNPTAGTTIDNKNAVDIKSNRNYGSSNTLANVLAYKGATGETMTDGANHLIFYQVSNGRLFATIDEVLPTGASLGIKFDPQPSNSSQDVYAALICHLDDPEDDN